MNRAADSIVPLTPVARMRYWWRRLAASVLPGRGENVTDRATARLLSQLSDLFRDHRAQRGGEHSERDRAERIAAIYRAAAVDQRAAILNLITHAFAPERDALDAALGAMQSASGEAELSRAEAQLRRPDTATSTARRTGRAVSAGVGGSERRSMRRAHIF